jgi:chemotaxis family two-component system response regulator Rcp1
VSAHARGASWPDDAALTPARLVQILLVEDSPADVELTRQALADGKVANRVHVVGDGEAALAFVRRQQPFPEAPRPDLILLDLNLPRKDGREVLVELKADPALRAIPVVVLTTSAADQDILHAYEHHVSSYIRKPVRLEEFMEVVCSVDDYWLGIVSLPPALAAPGAPGPSSGLEATAGSPARSHAQP